MKKNIAAGIFVCVMLPSKVFFTFEGICVPVFFFGTAARGTLQDVKRERPKSRFAAVQTLNPENTSPTP